MSKSHSTFTFLLGSGVSRAAELPDVWLLSKKIAAEIAGAPASLLKEIKTFCRKIHGEKRHTYEDWYFVGDQILEHQSGNLENPAMLPLMARLRAELHASDNGILAMAERLCETIPKIVCCALSTGHSRPDVAFAGLADAIRERGASKFRFFSLNHDLLLETFLKQPGIDPYVCLAQHREIPACQRVHLSRSAFDRARVSVVKLHGSVDWRAIRPCYSHDLPNPFRGEFIGVPIAKDRTYELIDDLPRILMGTFNKVVRYSTPVFLPLFAEFQRSLRNSNCLIVCGYGFGDKGVNTLVNDWMCSAKNPRMLVVDPKPFDKSRCRLAILTKVAGWKDDGRLKVKKFKVGIGPKDMSWTKILKIADAHR